MEGSPASLTCFVLLIMLPSAFPYSLHPTAANAALYHRDYTAVSEFRLLNRRALSSCHDPNPYIRINVTTAAPALSDDEFVTVTVSGVLEPSETDWVAMVSPSYSGTGSCIQRKIDYIQTGDVSDLPLLCHYPVKAQYVKHDPDYLTCKKKECKMYKKEGGCEAATCSGELIFHVVNIRTDIEFVFFAGGFATPCVLSRSSPVSFGNPKQPMSAHISSIDSTATAVRVTWVSGSKEPQLVEYSNGRTQISQVITFGQEDMCTSSLASPAKDFGWHDPGFIHTAMMTELSPLMNFSYRYGSDAAGWSNINNFRTPPAGGSEELKFLAYGDMGKAPLDLSVEHYIQPGSISVIEAMKAEVESGNVNSIFHIGDISYATGFIVEWDYFLHLISPLASRVPYMTAIGNHERDYINSGSVYITPDSGGECGVAYETYFQMPAQGKDKPWYSIEQGSVHFTVISTEHDWSEKSEQYAWMKRDLKSVNHSRTPWLIFAGHRPMYSSLSTSVDLRFRSSVEPLLVANKVDLAIFGHVHNYERTCSIYEGKCVATPFEDVDGVDTYDHRNYRAPVQAVIGMAGFKLDGFAAHPDSWSLRRIKDFGYLRGHAKKQQFDLEFVNSKTRQVGDRFRIIK